MRYGSVWLKRYATQFCLRACLVSGRIDRVVYDAKYKVVILVYFIDLEERLNKEWYELNLRVVEG
jgi:hypothetical protein